jgi:hypothetical protein
MNTRLVLILAVVVLGIVGAAVWFLQMQPPAVPVAGSTPAPGPSPATTSGVNTSPIAPLPNTDTANTTAKATPRKVTTPPRTQTEWEARIDQVLDLQAPETETAKMLINLMPTLPPDGQAEAAQHITNLILDKDYGLVMPMLRNPAYGEAVQDVLITDLMNREDNVKLPALLDVARIPNHPYHEEAMTDLQIFLDQDYGTNWAKWDTSMREYLRKQAAEEAALNAPEPAPAQ